MGKLPRMQRFSSLYSKGFDWQHRLPQHTIPNIAKPQNGVFFPSKPPVVGSSHSSKTTYHESQNKTMGCTLLTPQGRHCTADNHRSSIFKELSSRLMVFRRVFFLLLTTKIRRMVWAVDCKYIQQSTNGQAIIMVSVFFHDKILPHQWYLVLLCIVLSLIYCLLFS